MRYKNVGRSFFRFVAIHAFDGQADGCTDGYLARGYTVRCIICSRTVINKVLIIDAFKEEAVKYLRRMS